MANTKRRYPRKAFRRTVSIMCNGKACLVEAVEIGEGGISFSFKKEIPLQQRLILNFFLSEKDFFSVKATLKNSVKAAGSFIYGTSFDDVPIALKRQIRTYVARTSLN